MTVSKILYILLKISNNGNDSSCALYYTSFLKMLLPVKHTVLDSFKITCHRYLSLQNFMCELYWEVLILI